MGHRLIPENARFSPGGKQILETMILILALFGVLTAVAGFVLFVRARQAVGLLLIGIGMSLVALGVVAILNFHP